MRKTTPAIAGSDDGKGSITSQRTKQLLGNGKAKEKCSPLETPVKNASVPMLILALRDPL